MRQIPWRRAASVLAMMACAPLAHADYPDHPVRLIVPFAPGGAVDGAARPTSVELAKTLGQPVVIDNRPGSGGTIGISLASHAPADGYNLLLGNIALAAAPALYPKSGIGAADFAPVALIGSTPYILAVRPDFPAKSLAELVALAKANPGKYNYGSAGAGSAIHLAGEMFKSKAGVDIVHVPYRGAGPAMAALLGGEVQMMFGSLMEMKPQLQAGKLRPLAVTSASRSALAPGVPTFIESGVKDFQVTGWYGVYAPAKVPADVLAKLRTAAVAALHSESMRQQLAHYEMEPATGGAREAGEMLQNETERWAEVIRQAGITVQ